MTETTKTVFEKYEVRKTKKQKTAFIEFVRQEAAKENYSFHVENGPLGARNIIIGSPEKAKIVYTAHYDTCAILPFPNFITPKNFLIYLLYQILITVLIMFVPLIAINALWIITANAFQLSEELISTVSLLITYAILIFILVFLYAGPANKHTANDNTSGVTMLLDLMREMPKELREHVTFVFFDLEESGLIGSSAFAKKHKQTMKNKPLINFDCVSDGEHILFVLKKGAKAYQKTIEETFVSNENIKTEIKTKGVFYPSDQANFPIGIGVAALKRSKRFGVEYMDRIHTKRDTVYREENIQFLVKGAIELTKNII